MLVAIMFGVQQDAFKTTNNAKAELERHFRDAVRQIVEYRNALQQKNHKHYCKIERFSRNMRTKSLNRLRSYTRGFAVISS